MFEAPAHAQPLTGALPVSPALRCELGGFTSHWLQAVLPLFTRDVITH